MKCAACGSRAHHKHHVLPQQKIKVYARGMKRDGILVGVTRLLNDPRNLMDLCHSCHFSHEGWAPRLTRDKVPEEAWEFASTLGDWAVYTLERDYPVHPNGDNPSHGFHAHPRPAGADGADPDPSA